MGPWKDPCVGYLSFSSFLRAALSSVLVYLTRLDSMYCLKGSLPCCALSSITVAHCATVACNMGGTHHVWSLSMFEYWQRGCAALVFSYQQSYCGQLGVCRCISTWSAHVNCILGSKAGWHLGGYLALLAYSCLWSLCDPRAFTPQSRPLWCLCIYAHCHPAFAACGVQPPVCGLLLRSSCLGLCVRHVEALHKCVCTSSADAHAGQTNRQPHIHIPA